MWLLYCRKLNRVQVAEQNEAALAYRAEWLGTMAIHFVVRALQEFGAGLSLPAKPGMVTIGCDSKGVISCLSPTAWVSPSTPQGGVICVDAVKAHHWITLLEHLNCLYDASAKEALYQALVDKSVIGSGFLPCKKVAILIDGVKISHNLRKCMRFHLSMAEARSFYSTTLGWATPTFNSADWAHLDQALTSSSKMFSVRLSKQVSGFSATDLNMHQWFGQKHTQCPNCRRLHKRAGHLLPCPNAGRTQLLRDSISDISGWLLGPHTAQTLGQYVLKYLKQRGAVCFVDLHHLPPALHDLAWLQDSIGWDSIVLSRVSTAFFDNQAYLLDACSSLTAQDWVGCCCGLHTHNGSTGMSPSMTKFMDTRGFTNVGPSSAKSTASPTSCQSPFHHLAIMSLKLTSSP
eukprot:CCRYP_021153-RA/>CCRYP_021153-RA protein AED:0.30 eAED:0.40 QI:0/0/0/1/0/0/3/0/402